MKQKPQVHFWTEIVARRDAELGGQNIIALNCCRAWDMPANGCFLLFMDKELISWDQRTQAREKLVEKLEARERALVNWYGRQAKHHLDQFSLTPAERRAAAGARTAQHEF